MKNFKNRILTLEEKHAVLDKQIDMMEREGTFDDHTINVLKKQRLQLRDNIVKLEQQQLEVQNGQTGT
jgi:hypothetical protein